MLLTNELGCDSNKMNGAGIQSLTNYFKCPITKFHKKKKLNAINFQPNVKFRQKLTFENWCVKIINW